MLGIVRFGEAIRCDRRLLIVGQQLDFFRSEREPAQYFRKPSLQFAFFFLARRPAVRRLPELGAVQYRPEITLQPSPLQGIANSILAALPKQFIREAQRTLTGRLR